MLALSIIQLHFNSRVQNMQNAPTNLGHPLATNKCRCLMKGSQRLDFRKEKTFAR